MKKVILILSILLMFLLGISRAEEIIINDFSGGLRNDVALDHLAENETPYIKDCDISKQGSLLKRKGYTRSLLATSYLYIPGGGRNKFVNDLDAYRVIGNKHLLYPRSNSTIALTQVRYVQGYYVARAGSSDTLKYYHVGTNRWGINAPDYEMHTALFNENLYIARKGTELTVYDGTNIWPARPIGPGQLKTIAIDSTATTGTLSGRYSYKYLYSYTGTTIDSLKQTAPSIASYSTSVDYGWIVLTGFVATPSPATFPYIKIYRKDNIAGSNYGYIGNIGYNDTIYYDDGDVASTTDTLKIFDHYQPPAYNIAPGCPTLTLQTYTHGEGLGGDAIFGDSPPVINVRYFLWYEDSTGRWSDAVQTKDLSTVDAGICDSTKVAMTNIPMPDSPHNIKYIKIARQQYQAWGTGDCKKFIENIDTFNLASITPSAIYTDSADYYVVQTTKTKYTNQSDDSMINFNPIDIVMRGSRAFAIGNPVNPNAVYYSEFYRPTCWPVEYLISIPSRKGDWFIRLWDTEKSLWLFRQNSIVELSGFSFYQFQANILTENVGLSAIRSLAGWGTDLYFVHTSGVYHIGSSGLERISQSIQATWDSCSVNQIRWMVGSIVNNEYWLMIPTASGKPSGTYIYDQYGKWRYYGFVYDDIISYSADTNQYDYTDGYMFIRNDTLFEINNGYTDNGKAIVREWQSKIYFSGPGRVKVNWFDFEAFSTIDSIKIYPYRDNGYILPQKVLKYPYTKFGAISYTDPTTGLMRYRLALNEICDNFWFKIKVYGGSSYPTTGELQSITINYTPWDEGKL